MEREELDCTEGCDGSHKHKWELEPHPYSSDFDTYVTDSDQEMMAAVERAALDAWDQCEPGDEKVIKIRMNAVGKDGKP